MSVESEGIQALFPDSPPPVAFKDFCRELSHAGQLYFHRIASAIDLVAPSPGRVVYVHTRKLSMILSSLQPVIFSAIDATTHLQVAQAHFVLTSAAALAFVDFVAESFPFRITEIRTGKETPFHTSDDNRPQRDFPTLLGGRGYVHSYVGGDSGDSLFSITSKMVFGELWEGVVFPASSDELQRVLAQYLLFHNHFRCVPWLEGKTPMQKLRTFEPFESVYALEGLHKSESDFNPTLNGFRKRQNLRSNPDNDSHTNLT
jgi:hypothetical protein